MEQLLKKDFSGVDFRSVMTMLLHQNAQLRRELEEVRGQLNQPAGVTQPPGVHGGGSQVTGLNAAAMIEQPNRLIPLEDGSLQGAETTGVDWRTPPNSFSPTGPTPEGTAAGEDDGRQPAGSVVPVQVPVIPSNPAEYAQLTPVLVQDPQQVVQVPTVTQVPPVTQVLPVTQVPPVIQVPPVLPATLTQVQQPLPAVPTQVSTGPAQVSTATSGNAQSQALGQVQQMLSAVMTQLAAAQQVPGGQALQPSGPGGNDSASGQGNVVRQAQGHGATLHSGTTPGQGPCVGNFQGPVLGSMTSAQQPPVRAQGFDQGQGHGIGGGQVHWHGLPPGIGGQPNASSGFDQGRTGMPDSTWFAETIRTVDLPPLPAVREGELGGVVIGDWMALIGPIMKDLSGSSSGWWEMITNNAVEAYQTWLHTDPVNRLYIQPRIPMECSGIWLRLEQRGQSMLLCALPETLKAEVLSSRQTQSVQILFRMFMRYQPGGLGERALLLRQLVEGVGKGPTTVLETLEQSSLEAQHQKSWGTQGGHSWPNSADWSFG